MAEGCYHSTTLSKASADHGTYSIRQTSSNVAIAPETLNQGFLLVYYSYGAGRKCTGSLLVHFHHVLHATNWLVFRRSGFLTLSVPNQNVTVRAHKRTLCASGCNSFDLLFFSVQDDKISSSTSRCGLCMTGLS
jgi:hypothetical protein